MYPPRARKRTATRCGANAASQLKLTERADAEDEREKWGESFVQPFRQVGQSNFKVIYLT
jgi:hypothetical protein